eukprot:767744-Hanusia_phi.AAC.1
MSLGATRRFAREEREGEAGEGSPPRLSRWVETSRRRWPGAQGAAAGCQMASCWGQKRLKCRRSLEEGATRKDWKALAADETEGRMKRDGEFEGKQRKQAERE